MSSPLPVWITLVRFAGDQSKGYWHITNIDYLEDPGANCNVYAIAFDEKGQPAFNSKAVQRFPNWDKPDATVLLDFNPNSLGQAVASFNMDGNGSSFDPGKGEVGPQSIAMFGNSDRVDGIGLPLRRHVTVTVTFQWAIGAPVPPTPPPTGDFVTHAEFRALLVSTLGDVLQKGV